MHDISGSPYYFDTAGENAMRATLQQLGERIELLRAQGRLSPPTLSEYYGQKRFEQIAESNALEGSTLSVGETELAVMKGITISGHDPGYSRDAQTLARALDELVRMAHVKAPTDVQQVKGLHELILGEHPSAGNLRTSEVRIRGSAHVPPRTWNEVMGQMEQWQAWSKTNAEAPALLRAAVLHAWLEHIHPFVDGNGRAGRAVTNLELVRAGYPPIIIRRKDRDQYLRALAHADGGNLGPFIEIVAGRMEDALRDLERAAQRKQGYDVQRQKLVRAQENRLALWNAGVHLLATSIYANLSERFAESKAEFDVHEYDQLAVDDFIDLCEGRPVRLSWAFTIRCKLPGIPAIERLAWAGVVGEPLTSRFAREAGRPVLMWSVPNPDRYPPWIRAGDASPAGEQMTIHRDRWLVARAGVVREYEPSELAAAVAESIVEACIPAATL